MAAWKDEKKHSYTATIEIDVANGVTIADVAVMIQEHADTLVTDNKSIVISSRLTSVEEYSNEEEDE